MVKASQVHAGRGFPAFFAMLGDDIGENATAHIKLGGQAHEARFGRLDQIIQDAIGDVFVKVAFLTKSPNVQFQAFEFDAGFVGNVIQIQGREIGLAGFGAQTSELGDFHMDVKIALGLGIGKGFQQAEGGGGHGGGSV